MERSDLYGIDDVNSMEVPSVSGDGKESGGKLPEGWNLDRSELSTEDIMKKCPVAFRDLED